MSNFPRKVFNLISAYLIVSVVLLGLGASAAHAENNRCVVLGADLTEEQINEVYSYWGITRGSVDEIFVTNAEEREYLTGLIADEQLGTRAISCVYIEVLPEASGLKVNTVHINWCTPEMYMSALSTAGIMDAYIHVAAPFDVSGTSALTGVYKAYEHITGLQLNRGIKQVANEELAVNGELAERLGAEESTKLISELKAGLATVSSMSDEELKLMIRSVAGRAGVTLSDSEVEKLLSLCRHMEALDADAIKERAEKIQDSIDRIKEVQQQAVSFLEKLSAFLTRITAYIDSLKSMFQ